ncbi:hypothetical protein E2C01_007413 [Portunus trituberculatus]|uniref:Uncharacterized protein n=1 Tax=Portunus trituberculatus TaxID=210409 RepID=A0A5B7D477_PORTR|nr:hypothetical protein [Portunus trituberculatus]
MRSVRQFSFLGLQSHPRTPDPPWISLTYHSYRYITTTPPIRVKKGDEMPKNGDNQALLTQCS